MDLLEVFCIFLCGYAVRDAIGMTCLAGALTRIEQKLGTGQYERAEAPDDLVAAFRRFEGAE